MKVLKWQRYRSSRELEPAEFKHRARRVVGFKDNPIIVEVINIYNPGKDGFDAGWDYLIMNINGVGPIRSEQFNSRELAMFMADLKLIDLGFDLESPFTFNTNSLDD